MEGSGDEQASGKKRLLSKSAIYTPLVAYQQSKVEPSAYVNSQASLPKVLRETSLNEFWQSVSFKHHREQATSADAKNNGSRPLSVSDVEDRIKQRALVLIGGTAAPLSTGSQGRAKKSRKRPRKSWEEVKGKLQNTMRPDNPLDSVGFLRTLNKSWNEYIGQVLRLDSCSSDTSTLQGRFVAVRDSIELAGAHVKLSRCNQRRNLVGSLAVLLGESKNMWTVARMTRPKSGKSATDNNNANDDKNATVSKASIEAATIPKRGSSLVLILPFPNDTEASMDAEDKELIVQADQSICITLDSSHR